MLIRHISIPKNSNLVLLKEPKQRNQTTNEMDFTDLLSRTLNPQSPNNDTLFFHVESSKLKGKSINRTQSLNKRQSSFLGKQTPILLNQYLSNQDISPRKQSSKFNKYEQAKTERIQLNEIYKNPHIFNTFTPPLHKNAYLMKPIQNQYKQQQYQSNFHYSREKQGEEEEEISLNKHQSKFVKNSQLYKTLQKFKSRRLANETLQQNKLNQQKKYSYSLPKQIFSQTQKISKENQIEAQDAKIQKKKFRSKQIIINPKATSPNIIDRKKKSLPKDDQNQNQIKYIQPNIERNQIPMHKQFDQSSILFNKEEKQYQSIIKPEKITKYFQPTQPSQPKLQISYRTSLAKLKQICCTESLDKYIVTMKIPEIFAYPMFTGNQEQGELFNKAEQILKHLQVQFKTDIQLKKYTNCITIIVNRISIIWHYSGKVYFGGWKNQIFDQGCKQGLGLQWSPKKYVYYGQYHKNKRSGIGIMKNNENQIFAGYWRDNHFIRSLSNNQEQFQNKLFSVIK